MKTIIFNLFLMLSSSLLASEASDRASPTAFLIAGGGFHVQKSELVDSNDTGTSVKYGLGIWAGEDRSMGIHIVQESNSTTFALNDATMAQTWRDVVIKYRLGPVYFGPVLSQMAMTAESGDLSLDLSGQGYGFNAGWTLGFLRNTAWYFDAVSASISEVRDTELSDVSVGSRTDLDTGFCFFLTKQTFDMMFGYRMRTYSVSTGSSFAESQNLTYLAFRANLFL